VQQPQPIAAPAVQQQLQQIAPPAMQQQQAPTSLISTAQIVILLIIILFNGFLSLARKPTKYHARGQEDGMGVAISGFGSVSHRPPFFFQMLKNIFK
jgi:hypothetical protein